jgi:hypothetical protein
VTIEYLENLARAGELRRLSPSEDEISTLIRKGLTRLNDLAGTELSAVTRFDVAYNAAYALSLAALWKAGYRSKSRYLVFQCTQHTVDLTPENWRILDLAHRKRNLVEYEGEFDIEDSLIEALLRVTEMIAGRLQSA